MERSGIGSTSQPSGWVPTRMRAVYKEGAGWQIEATFENGKQGCMVDTGAVDRMFAYAPWLGPFAPQSFRDMIGRTLTQMAEAWNEKHAPNMEVRVER